MKSLLYDELRELARKILEAPEGEISSLQGDARVLYEKLTVLRYTEGLVEELRQSMETDGEEPVQEPEAVEPMDDDLAPEMPDEPTETLSEQCGDEPLAEETPEDEEEDIPVQQQPEIVESVTQTTVTTVEQTVAVVQEEDDTVTVEKTVRVTEKKTTDRSYDDIQQSLFGDDLFTKELDFDPDEDLFEDKADRKAEADQVSNEKIVIADDADRVEATVYIEEEVSIETTDIPAGGVEELQKEEKENESASFFSFQVVQEEEEPKDSNVDTAPEENNKEPDPAEEKAPEMPDEQAETLSEQRDEEQPEEILEELEADIPQQQVPEEEKIPDDLPEDKEKIVAERSRTLNDAAAQKEEDRRPSLNEILAASDVKMDLNDRIAFINHLFDGDAEAFETSVSYIFSLTDIDVANEYIIEILKPSYNNWFEKEKYERRFSEIVLRHFMNKK